MTFTTYDDDADRVVWTVVAEDPWSVIDRPDDADPAAAQDVAARAAADNGLVLEHVIDTDDADGVNYYEYALTAPRDRHPRASHDRPPEAVAAVMHALRDALPHPSLRWSVAVDAGLTSLLHTESVIRRAHLPLVEAFEAVLLPLRVDGAEHLDPNIGVSRLAGGRTEGHYAVYLCKQPDAGLWCRMHVGVAPDLPYAPTRERHHDANRGRLVLPMPPPDPALAPVVYGAEITTGPFGGLASRWESSPSVVGWGGDKPTHDGVGSRHQWLANDPDVLAAKVARTVELWWPDGATPPAGPASPRPARPVPRPTTMTP